MTSFVYQCLFVIAIGLKVAHQYPSGAPSAACGNMKPQHGVSSQACSANYIIQSDKTQYYSNDTVRITVNSATSSDTFRGILLIAKTASSSQIIGSWTVSDSNLQTLACNSVADTGVTHTSNSDKTSATAIWTPPSSASSEDTVIGVTIVKVYNTIYVGCFTVTLTNKQGGQSSTGTTASTTAAGGGASSTLSSSITTLSSSVTTLSSSVTTLSSSVTTLSSSVTTLSSSVTTVSSSVTTVSSSTTTISTTIVPQSSAIGANIAWTYNNGVTSVKMKITNLKTSQWLAIGLSLDQYMGNDHVFVCKRLSDDTVTAERRVNPGGHNYPVPASTISDPGETFNVTSAKLVDGTVSCEFILSNLGSSKRRRRDTVTTLSPSTSYYPLIAIGNLDSSNQLIQHMTRTALSQIVRLNQQETINYNTPNTNVSGLSSSLFSLSLSFHCVYICVIFLFWRGVI